MTTRTVFLDFCAQVAASMEPLGFKALQKGQRLKKVSPDKDTFFEVYFQSSTYNAPSYVQVLPHIGVYSKRLKKWSVEQTGNPHENGYIYGDNIGQMTPLKRRKEWNVAGVSLSQAAVEVTELLQTHVVPIFDLFSNREHAIEFLKNNGTVFNPWCEKSLQPLAFMICFGAQADAEAFFNDYIRQCKYKKRITGLYQHMETAASIDLNSSEFVDAGRVKLGFVNGLKIVP